MKKLLFIFLAISLSTTMNAQWTTNGNDIGYNSGSVGIGTTSPSKLLTIASSADVYMRLVKLGQSNFFDLGIVTHTAQIGYTAGTSTNSNISFLTNGVSRMYFSDDGKIGIGTIDPTETLDVRGNIIAKTSSSTNSYVKVFASGTGNAGIFFDASDGDGIGGDYAGLIQKDNLEIELTNYGDNAIKFRTNDTNRVTILGDGRVGIGTISPTEALDIRGNAILKTSSSTNSYMKVFATGTGNAGIFFDAADGDGMGSDYAGLMQKDNLEIELNNYGSNPIRLRTANTDRITILGGGNVGIGTTTPGEKLEVNGNALIQGEVYSTKIKVSTNPGGWPDYVFEKNYSLTPLNELENYLKTNKHLPEVPSAKEVEANGQDLGDIQAILLKKVEELTLYMIEQNKKQVSLEERLKTLEEENKRLKKELQK